MRVVPGCVGLFCDPGGLVSSLTTYKSNSMAKMRQNKEDKVDLITSAARKRQGFISTRLQDGRKRSKCVVPEQASSARTEGSEENVLIDLETPVVNSLPVAAEDTISTDNSTRTAESLEQNGVNRSENTPPHPLSVAFSQTSSKVVTYSECSEVVVSQQEVSCATTGQVPDADEDVYEEIEFDPFAFIKTLPPLSACVPARNDFLLPRLTRHSQKKKTLVLDLDETLVHSTLDDTSEGTDFMFPVPLGNITHMVAVRKRPHLHTFLERMARCFEIVVFTASQQIYAEQLLDIVDPNGKCIRHRVYRDSCVVWEGNYLKDLTVLGRDLAHTIIVDNSPQAFGFQLDNGIPIESWYDDDEDIELLRLIPFLEQLAHVDDVRPHIGEKFGLRDLVDAAPDLTYI